MPDSFVRRRPVTEPTTRNSSISSGTGKSNANVDGALERGGSTRTSLLDALRVLTTLVALTLLLSYYLTSGDSWTFNYRPWYTRPGRLGAYIRGPLHLTSHQLSLYNGTDPTLPIYLSVNRTIFDVSSSRHTYGPGGSYHVFAGRDATRAFVTGCFSEDLTDDLRGVERMWIPIEDVDDEEDGDGRRGEKANRGMSLTSGQRKIRAEQEKREARKKVEKEVDKWVTFYRNSAKYFEVGRLMVDQHQGSGSESDIGRNKKPDLIPKLCETAEKARPRRSQLNRDLKAAAAEAGKTDSKKQRPGSKGKPV